MSISKILIISPYLSIVGGVSNFNSTIYPFLSNEYNVKIIEIGSKYKKGYISPIVDQIKFGFVVNNYQPDLIQINTSLNFRAFMRDAVFIYHAYKKRIKTMVFVHGWDDEFFNKIKKIRFYKRVFDNTFKNTVKILVLSREFKQKLIELGMQENRIELFFPPVSDLFLKTISRKEIELKMIREKVINILFLARMEKEKGIYTVINVFNSIKNDNLNLHIVGGGTIIEDVKRYLSKKNDKRIIFHGYVDNDRKIEILKKSHIYCFPTEYKEGLPITVLEAMATGNAIIVSPVGGIKDFFENKKMGFFISPQNKEEIEETIVSMYANRKMMFDMGIYNHEYVKKYFSIDVLIEKLYNIYEQI